MIRHIEEKVMREVSERTKHDVTLSKESFYSGEMRMHYKRLVVDGKQTMHHVDLMDLQSASSRGRLTEEVRKLSSLVLLG